MTADVMRGCIVEQQWPQKRSGGAWSSLSMQFSSVHFRVLDGRIKTPFGEPQPFILAPNCSSWDLSKLNGHSELYSWYEDNGEQRERNEKRLRGCWFHYFQQVSHVSKWLKHEKITNCWIRKIEKRYWYRQWKGKVMEKLKIENWCNYRINVDN